MIVINQLEKFPLIVNSTEYQQLISRIKTRLQRFQSYQEEIIAITQEPVKNIPALRIANEQANPKASQTLELIAQMIQTEAYEQLLPLLDAYKADLDELFLIHGSEKAYQDRYLIRTELGPLVTQVGNDLQQLTSLLNLQISNIR